MREHFKKLRFLRKLLSQPSRTLVGLLPNEKTRISTRSEEKWLIFWGTKYFVKIWIVKYFNFNSLIYRVPPNFFCFDSKISLSLWKAITFGKILIYLSFQGPSSGSPKAVRYFFFGSKPIQKASFLHFRKSQEFSGYVGG